MIEDGLVSYLISYPGVAALVGTRIYPAVLPQGGVLPAITYHRVSGGRVYSLYGPSGLAYPRFQINCWALDYGMALTLAEAVRYALDGYAGLAGASMVSYSLLSNDLDDYEPETKLWRRVLDFIVWHEEEVV